MSLTDTRRRVKKSAETAMFHRLKNFQLNSICCEGETLRLSLYLVGTAALPRRAKSLFRSRHGRARKHTATDWQTREPQGVIGALLPRRKDDDSRMSAQGRHQEKQQEGAGAYNGSWPGRLSRRSAHTHSSSPRAVMSGPRRRHSNHFDAVESPRELLIQRRELAAVDRRKRGEICIRHRHIRHDRQRSCERRVRIAL